MSDTSPRLDLPYIAPSQAQKHVTHNEAIRRLDGLTQIAVKNFNATTPPGAPENGDMYALAASPTGDWAGHAAMLALWSDNTWIFMPPDDGWLAWGVAEEELRAFSAGIWQEVVPELQNLESIGINTAADLTNRLAINSDASLFNNDGGGHQIKINKATIGDTASLLYQSGWSGHAEMGLTGDNDFHIKVSPDGSSWSEALIINQNTGYLSGNAIQASATDTTAGRVALAQHAYSPGNLLGGVSESAGTPTGAVIERGSNANGDYVRFADGSQICTHELTLDAPNSASGSIYQGAAATTWTFPTGFATGSKPSVSASDTNIGELWVSAYCAGENSATLHAMRAASSGTAPIVSVTAFGRWF